MQALEWRRTINLERRGTLEQRQKEGKQIGINYANDCMPTHPSKDYPPWQLTMPTKSADGAVQN